MVQIRPRIGLSRTECRQPGDRIIEQRAVGANGPG
jgi:hypothetical protein